LALGAFNAAVRFVIAGIQAGPQPRFAFFAALAISAGGLITHHLYITSVLQSTP
jgi:hypothetical protein